MTKQSKQPAIYILANKPNGTIYTGVTSDLAGRVWQHKEKLMDGFSKQYGCDKLMYFEMFDDMLNAIAREKQIKAGSRLKKAKLIVSVNPEWKDLYETLF